MAENPPHYPGPRTAPVRPAAAVRSVCECGSDTFRLAGIEITAVCTGCGAATPLGVTAFRIRL